VEIESVRPNERGDVGGTGMVVNDLMAAYATRPKWWVGSGAGGGEGTR